MTPLLTCPRDEVGRLLDVLCRASQPAAAAATAAASIHFDSHFDLIRDLLAVPTLVHDLLTPTKHYAEMASFRMC